MVHANSVGLSDVDEFALANAAWYVAPTGNDINSCSTPDDPCQTLQRGIDVSSAGDTVLVAAGPYYPGTAQISINKAPSLLGGWDGDFSHQTGFSTLDFAGNRGNDLGISQDATVERLILKGGDIGVWTSGSNVVIRQSSVSGMSGQGIK